MTQKPLKFKFALVAGNPQGPERLVTGVGTTRAFFFLGGSHEKPFNFCRRRMRNYCCGHD